MKVTKSKPIGSGHTIEVGSATWDESETSIRNRYETSSGGFSPRSSSELPIHDVKEILTVVADEDLLEPKDIVAIIASLAASLDRQL